ncbi:IBR [Aspergillus sclerotialis]|uniref:IBR n=1 Tax=Aspergillus sclerotialis TaxID=2070753 RepID=A0A3A2Z5K8_9EURO|nr:IBR [Aspergillus sclerotialis]
MDDSQSTKASVYSLRASYDIGALSSQRPFPGLRRYRHREHKRQAESPTREDIALGTGHDGNMFQPTITWGNEDTHYWADAETAGAVLSLLRKEPLHAPPIGLPDPESERQIQDSACVVCFEKLDCRLFPQSPIASSCDHTSIPEADICISCLQRSLQIQLSSTGPNSLACPLCHAQLSSAEVQKWATRDTFETYNTLNTQTTIENDAEYIRCARRSCRFGQFHAGGREDPIVVCRSCGTRTCFIHRDTIWHQGLTCDEYDEIMNFRTDTLRRGGNRGRANGFLQLLRGMRPYRRMARPDSQGGHVDSTTEEILSRRIMDKTTKPCPRYGFN